MKNITLLALLTYLLFCGCNSHNKKNNIILNSKNPENFGNWKMLTIQKNDSILFQPCDADNRSITYTKDSIFDNTGQEDVRCRIQNTFEKGNRTYISLEKGCSYSDTISFEKINYNLIHWYLYNGVNFLSTNETNKYKIVEQPCSECQSLEECEKIDIVNKKNIINGNWGYSCESPASISIKNENNILFAVMSNQIYIRAKLKEIEPNKFELYLIEPDDLGPGGMRMNWSNFSKNRAIATIDLLKNGTVNFLWIGFYDEKEKEIIFPDCEFNLESDNTNPVVLRKCL
ncbi:hypothetical protein O2K51_04035 [Apibacter raozihei]|uniref:hypothetical protein n=1 Tax=Apibacter raozihei TaxID=2500547 RepID=UPI000FE2C639|nr:hypothetical protein [Apibacter raozihei]